MFSQNCNKIVRGVSSKTPYFQGVKSPFWIRFFTFFLAVNSKYWVYLFPQFCGVIIKTDNKAQNIFYII